MSERAGLLAATVLYGANRFVVAGVISASLGLAIQAAWGEVRLANGALIGIATLTGIMLGVNPLISMIAAPLAGHWSDQARSRWRVAAWGLLPGAAGLALLATVQAWAIVPGVVLVAIAGGSNQSFGDGRAGRRDRRPATRAGDGLDAHLRRPGERGGAAIGLRRPAVAGPASDLPDLRGPAAGAGRMVSAPGGDLSARRKPVWRHTHGVDPVRSARARASHLWALCCATSSAFTFTSSDEDIPA